MRLLKSWVPFFWYESTQCSFDALKKALISAPLLSPLDYNKYFMLYLATPESFIGMVLVQEDDELKQHVIYYLSRGLVGSKLKYSHVEKLVLAAFHVVQRLQHYILLRKTTIVADVNPFQYVLTRLIIGGKYNKWIVELQEFDLDFSFVKSKKSLVFAELMSEFPTENQDDAVIDSFLDEHIFLISSFDPWYGDIIIYLQTLKCPSHFLRDKRRHIRHLVKNYLIFGDNLYHRGVYSILRRCLTRGSGVGVE